MATRWTQADIVRKGLKVANAAAVTKKTVTHTKGPAMYALGRLKNREMNKTEQCYSSHLEFLRQTGDVLWYEFEPMNLRLGDKCFYKVDFLVMAKTGQLEVHEVKGFWTDDALVKIKTAAEKFPFRFISVTREKGAWKTREF
jgi:hypothetical protein